MIKISGWNIEIFFFRLFARKISFLGNWDIHISRRTFYRHLKFPLEPYMHGLYLWLKFQVEMLRSNFWPWSPWSKMSRNWQLWQAYLEKDCTWRAEIFWAILYRWPWTMVKIWGQNIEIDFSAIFIGCRIQFSDFLNNQFKKNFVCAVGFQIMLGRYPESLGSLIDPREKLIFL